MFEISDKICESLSCLQSSQAELCLGQDPCTLSRVCHMRPRFCLFKGKFVPERQYAESCEEVEKDRATSFLINLS